MLGDYDPDEGSHRDSTAGGKFVFCIAVTSTHCSILSMQKTSQNNSLKNIILHLPYTLEMSTIR